MALAAIEKEPYADWSCRRECARVSPDLANGRHPHGRAVGVDRSWTLCRRRREPVRHDHAAVFASAGEWNRGNLEGFIAPYAQESTFMTAAGPVGRVHMVERYRTKYFAADRPLQTLRFDELAVRVLGPDHALMTGRFQLTGGGLPDQSGRFTLVWLRTGDSWRILHDHSS